jgi:hypothetical protein
LQSVRNESNLALPFEKPTLVYEDGEAVQDQSILRECGPPKAFRAGEDTVVLFRIDEVSRSTLSQTIPHSTQKTLET